MSTNSETAYLSAIEHLNDEIKRLDLLLKLKIARDNREDSINKLDTIAVSMKEICNLMGVENFDGYDENLLTNEIRELEDLIDKKLEAGLGMGVNFPLMNISGIYNLNKFEKGCIIACMALELDRKYEKIFGFLQNNIYYEKYPSVGLMMDIFCDEDMEKIQKRQAFGYESPIMNFFFETGGEFSDRCIPLISRRLKLDDWVVSYLLDVKELDERLRNVAQRYFPESTEKDNTMCDISQKIIDSINHYRLSKGPEAKQMFYLHGQEGAGKKTCVREVCSKLGLPLIIADIGKMLSMQDDFGKLIKLLKRHAMFENTVICFSNFDSLENENEVNNNLIAGTLMKFAAEFVPLSFILGKSAWSYKKIDSHLSFVSIEIPYPDINVRKALWESFSKNYSLDEKVNLDDFAGSFRFTPGQIESALRFAESLSVWNGSENALIGRKELLEASYSQSNEKLCTLATKIKKSGTWDMLVLPNEQMNELKDICSQLKFRKVVYNDWGFENRLSLGKGLNVLFSGPPGSGKTMAAEVIATELGMEIYKIDVSRIVSKYIGETEKNLSRIFLEAETSNAILFFDEADALFGKRSDVKDAHDRYANVETSYLLQKIEEYAGMVILATNLSQNIDEAFLRRLHFHIEFPFPQKEQRLLIWESIFPADAPLNKDLDYDFMAEKFILAGGNIKNIALNAAFSAAQDMCPIGMKQIMLAAKREYKKLSKPFVESDFDPYYQLIEVIRDGN